MAERKSPRSFKYKVAEKMIKITKFRHGPLLPINPSAILSCEPNFNTGWPSTHVYKKVTRDFQEQSCRNIINFRRVST